MQLRTAYISKPIGEKSILCTNGISCIFIITDFDTSYWKWWVKISKPEQWRFWAACNKLLKSILAFLQGMNFVRFKNLQKLPLETSDALVHKNHSPEFPITTRRLYDYHGTLHSTGYFAWDHSNQCLYPLHWLDVATI